MTDLFLKLKPVTTRAIVEQIGNDLDEIVRVVRFKVCETRKLESEKKNGYYEKLFGQSIKSKTKIYLLGPMIILKSIINRNK